MRKLTLILLLSSVGLSTPALAQTSSCNWTGSYSGTDGHIRIIQTGETVAGEYTDGMDAPFLVNGRVNRQCEFSGHTRHIDNSQKHSEFWMVKTPKRVAANWIYIGNPQQFKIQFEQKSSARPQFNFAQDPAILQNRSASIPQSGVFSAATTSKPVIIQNAPACDWSGGYNTSYGVLRLAQNGSAVAGDYGGSKIVKGTTTKDCVFTGVFQNPGARTPEGRMTLTLNNDAFTGPWHYEGQASTANWTGTRTTKTTKLFRAAEPAYLPFAETLSNAQPTTSFTPQKPVKAGKAAAPLINTKKETAPLKIGQSSSAGNDIAEGLARTQQENNRRAARERYIQDREDKRAAERQARMDKHNAEMAAIDRKDRKTKIRTWRVNPERHCVTRYKDPSYFSTNQILYTGAEIHSIGWVRARIIHKDTGIQHAVAPIKGFPNIKGDKERAYENGYAVGHGPGSQRGKCKTYPTGYELDYRIDAEKYGYKNMYELFQDDRNRIDVMFKLEEEDPISANDDLGTKRLATPFKDANFCPQCDVHESMIEFEFDSSPGALSFYHSDAQVMVFYTIRPLDD